MGGWWTWEGPRINLAAGPASVDIRPVATILWGRAGPRGPGRFRVEDVGWARMVVAENVPAAASKDVDKSGRRVRSMFASIAGKYDLLNHLLSLNIDKSWRTFTTRTVPPEPGVPVLDCCTGTADLALEYHKAGRGRSPVVGSDFCHEMLVIGNKKVAKARAEGAVILIEGDTQRLPLPDDHFGVVTVAFGLRNVADTVKGIDEMVRVARPGGKVAILEFSRPRGAILGRLYLTFFKHVLPKVGQAIAPNSYDAYSYLPASVLQFPDGRAMLDLLASRGLTDLVEHPLTFGVATLYVGTKPAGAAG